MQWNMFNHLLKDQRKLSHGRSSSIKKCLFFFYYHRHHHHHHHIAIVGTGPSGLYTAKYLIEYYQKLILKDNKCNHQQQQQQQQQQNQNTVKISHNNDITLHTSSIHHHQQHHHHTQQIYIDFFEKLPTPYGLVRSGVAPDHPEVKSVEETFKKVLNSNNVRFFGNVIIHNNVKDNNSDDIIYDIEDVKNNNGNDNGVSRIDVLRYDDDDDDDNINSQSKQYHISLDDLRLSYSAIILAYGATSDIPLPLANNDNVNDDNIRNILSAREFVHWYNGHPDYANFFKNKGLR